MAPTTTSTASDAAILACSERNNFMLIIQKISLWYGNNTDIIVSSGGYIHVTNMSSKVEQDIRCRDYTNPFEQRLAHRQTRVIRSYYDISCLQWCPCYSRR